MQRYPKTLTSQLENLVHSPSPMKLKIRQETPSDYNQTKKIVQLAFDKKAEWTLVERLRKNPKFIPELSIVAEIEKQIVWHILIFPVHVIDGDNKYEILSLSPISVHPDFQSQWIWTDLVIEALKKSKKFWTWMIVLWHKDYYPRFWFKPASKRNIKPPFEIPDEVFLAIELKKDWLKNISWIVEYPHEFMEVC